MYCGECGTENQSGAQTCEVCGSPLQPGSGPQTCQVCGSPASEHDRFCRACGSTLSGGARYEPGPSFVDDLPLDFNPADLPPWLREMVDSAGAAPQFELSTANGPSAGTGTGTGTATMVEQAIPSWLRTERAAPTPAPSAPTAAHEPPPTPTPVPTPMPTSIPIPSTPQPEQVAAGARPAAAQSSDSSFSFLSEDDLPEWLRALGDEAPAEPVATAQAPSQPAPRPSALSSSAPTTAPSPPSVSRAWLARPRTVEPTASAEAAEEFAPLAPLSQSGRAGARRASTPTGLQQGQGQSKGKGTGKKKGRGRGQGQAHDTGEMPIVAGSAEPRRSRTLLMVLVVLVVLAVLGLALVQFVL